MRAAVIHQRGERIIDSFMTGDIEITRHPDGSETFQLLFPKTLTVLSGDKVTATYYTSEK
jgi:hypothetical protein